MKHFLKSHSFDFAETKSSDIEIESDVDMGLIDSDYEPSDTHSETHSECNISQCETAPLENNTELFSEATKIVTKKNPRTRRKHHCYFCGQDIGNFARHLERNHQDEIQVQEIIALKKRSQKRKKLIDKLRREGDFSTSTIVPVLSLKRCLDDYLVCIFCRGYYAKKNLRRHAKKCFFNPDPTKRFKAQIEGQTFMVGNFGPNDVLKVSGLLTMLKPDAISMIAKKDTVICEVARRYIRSHKETHLLPVAKRYMRRLSRLLLKTRELEKNDRLNMIDILRPQKFEVLVQATQLIAEYDDKSRTFKSPSLALQMGTLIKHAINTASSIEMQKENCSKELLEKLRSLKELIETDWAHLLSSAAGQNLAINKFNKPSLIPLTADIRVINILHILHLLKYFVI